MMVSDSLPREGKGSDMSKRRVPRPIRRAKERPLSKRVIVTMHARRRMDERDITPFQVANALDYPDFQGKSEHYENGTMYGKNGVVAVVCPSLQEPDKLCVVTVLLGEGRGKESEQRC